MNLLSIQKLKKKKKKTEARRQRGWAGLSRQGSQVRVGCQRGTLRRCGKEGTVAKGVVSEARLCWGSKPRPGARPRYSLMPGGPMRISCPPATLYLVGVLTLSHLRGQVTCHLKADPGALPSLHAGLPAEAAGSCWVTTLSVVSLSPLRVGKQRMGEVSQGLQPPCEDKQQPNLPEIFCSPSKPPLRDHSTRPVRVAQTTFCK